MDGPNGGTGPSVRVPIRYDYAQQRPNYGPLRRPEAETDRHQLQGIDYRSLNRPRSRSIYTIFALN